MNYLDLTHTFAANMPVYPDDPVPELRQIADLNKDGYNDYQITTTTHVGTHIDAPLHMLEGGKRLSDFPVDKFFGRGCLIDARDASVIRADLLDKSSAEKGLPAQAGDIVLVLTGFAQKYRQPEYYEHYPEISEDFARRAIELGIKMIGVDGPSPDRPSYKIHKLLLGQEILIIENLTNLESLVGITNFEILALPLKLQADAAPARVVAKAA